MNLRDLAKEAGCSVSTVSKAFSGSTEISNETKERIFAVAKKLGCFEKYTREQYDKKLIAVLCPETESSYYTEFLSHLNRLITQHGGTMAISLTGFSKEKEEELLQFYASQNRADGIIVISGQTVTKKHTTIPIIHLCPYYENPYTDVVQLDYYRGFREAVYALKSCGHTKIAFIGEALTASKTATFLKAMKEYSMPVDPSLILVSDKRFEEAGFAAMEQLFQNNNLPSAVFAVYDYIALGAIRSIEDHGLIVPKNISVIGSDDIKLSHYHKIPLSSIRANIDATCMATVEQMFFRIQNPNYCSSRSISFRTSFIRRASLTEKN